MTTPQTVAVLGTGTMGFGMAGSLLRAGHSVRVWNRNPDRAAPLAERGAEVADTPAAAVDGADAVITMLYDADSVLSVAEQAGPVLAGAVWVQAATIGLQGIRRVAEYAAEHGLTVLDAPVLGTKAPAEQGTLVALCSGNRADYDRVTPVFEAISARTVWAGDELGAASALKLACNAWVASVNAATAQSVALARGLGLDPQLFLDAISGGPNDSGYAQLKAKQMMAGEYPPSFALDGVIKDLGLIRDAAGQSGVDDTLLAALLGLYGSASAAGRGDSDMAAVYTAF